MKLSIRTKILLAFAATLIITSALNLFFISQILRKDYSAALHSKLLILGDNLQTQLKRITSLGISTRDIEGFDQQCLDIVRKNENITRAMIIDRDGTIIFHSDPSQQGKKLLHQKIISSIHTGKPEVYSIAEKGENIYFAVLPFGDNPDHSEYAVVIASPASIINSNILKLINKCNIVLFSTFILGALLLLVILTTMLTRPLTVILNTMKDITKTRDLQKRVNINTYDEIGQIADAFNMMTADLQHTTTSIDCLNREISERKKVENELRCSETRFQQIVSNATEWIWEVDADGLYTYSSPIVEELLGYKPEEMVGKKHFYDLFLDKDRDELKRLSFEGFAQKQPFKGFVNANVHKNGRVIWLMTSGVPILDDNGNLIGYRGSDINITERKEAEEEIQTSKKVLQDMINAMPFGVVVIGKDKKIRQANAIAQQLTGFSENELVGQLCNKTLCPAELNNCPILDKNQKVDHSERKLITKDKKVIPIIKNVVQLRLGDEEILLEAFIDITERKEAEKKLKQLNDNLEDTNEEMKNFVFIASHDLREPLRKISSFGSMLQKSLEGKLDADNAENLHFMIEGAQRMNSMIEGLLAYSRVSTKTHTPQVVDLNKIVQQLRQIELSVLLQEKKVVIDIPKPLPNVKVDPVQISQLMQNLIANGIKYQKKDNIPRITITSKSAVDGMVKIEIKDNGIGIKPEYQQSVFVMFRRLHSNNEYEGTGIGLSVCRKIVERHGGQIGIESEENKGSTFWFTIPVAEKSVTAEMKVKEE
ncbi:MAG: PAS domain S-box protein [Phycisphaerae bacterium]|jgi:signal transduction histidine kinase/HAMP domain-containing protein